MSNSGDVLQSVARARERFASQADPKLAFDALLDEVLFLAGSDVGLIGEILETPDGPRFARISGSAAFPEAPLRELARTGEPIVRPGLIGLPLRRQGRPLGAVGWAKNPDADDDAVVRFLEPLLAIFADWIAARRAALERDEATHRLRARGETDALLAEVGARIWDAAADDLDAAIVDALERLSRHVDADRAVYLWKSDEMGAVIRSHFWGAEPPGGSGPDSYSMADLPWLAPRVLDSGFFFVPDFEALPDAAASERELYVDGGIRSGAFLGGRHRGEVVGVINLLWWTRDADAGPADLEPLSVVANVITVALHRRHAERVLREAGERLRALADASPAMMWVTQGGTLETRFVNQAMRRFLGAEMRDGFERAIHPGDQERTREVYERAVKRQRPFEVEFRIRRWDREMRSVMAFGAPQLSAAGDFHGYVVSCIDVTENKRLEEERRDAIKLEAVGRLAGGIAHDFNNLLTVILGRAEVALRELEAGGRPDSEIEAIQTSAEQAADLIRQLLSFARREASEPRVLDLNEVLRGTDTMLCRLLGEHVELDLRLADEPLAVRIDPGHLERLLVNLVLNARDAMPGGGTVRVAVARAVVDGAERGPGARITVSDTGVGMDPETLKHIFEPFFTTKELGQGTGLGLATCYGIVQQAGGEITAHSVASNGTTFEVWLPRVFENAEATDSDPAPRASLRGSETILVVEDEVAVRKAIEQALQGYGYLVMGADGWREALELAAERAIDLLVTDMVMPGKGGLEVASEVRERWPRARVLYISGYNAPDGDGAESISGFLAKPFTGAQLAARVRDALDAAPV